MFDETFFQTSLPAHIKAKGTESGAEPSVHVTLRNGQAYRLGRILEVSPQWVMCEVYPLDGEFWFLIRHGDLFSRAPKVEQQQTHIHGSLTTGPGAWAPGN